MAIEAGFTPIPNTIRRPTSVDRPFENPFSPFGTNGVFGPNGEFTGGVPAIPNGARAAFNANNAPGQFNSLGDSVGLDPSSFADVGGTDFFGENGGSRFVIPGLEALTGVANFFNAKDALDLGRDQFNLTRDASNRDFNSQAQVFNTNLADSKADQLTTSRVFDTSTPEGQAQFDAALDAYVKDNSIQESTI